MAGRRQQDDVGGRVERSVARRVVANLLFAGERPEGEDDGRGR